MTAENEGVCVGFMYLHSNLTKLHLLQVELGELLVGSVDVSQVCYQCTGGRPECTAQTLRSQISTFPVAEEKTHKRSANVVVRSLFIMLLIKHHGAPWSFCFMFLVMYKFVQV